MKSRPVSSNNYFTINRGKWKLASALGVTLLLNATSSSAMASTAPTQPDLLEVPATRFSRNSDSIWLGSYGSLSSWKPVARDAVVLWSSPTRAYLVKIWRPHNSLRHSQRLGVTRTGGRVTKFDKVLIDGWRYPIRSIERIDAGAAKILKYRSRTTARS